MYTTLLWATDGSAIADVALDEALKVLEPAGRLVAFHCDQRFFAGRAGGEHVLVDEPELLKTIQHRVEDLKQSGVAVELIVSTTHEAVARTIVETADEVGAQAIVCGTRGLGGLQSALLGSVAKDLLHESHVPLLVVPGKVAEKVSARVVAGVGQGATS